MIRLRILNAEPLEDMREAIAATLGKDHLEPLPEHTDLMDYYVSLFIANHSIVRAVRFRIKDDASGKSVARQLLRATTGHPQPYMESSRPDWTGKPRDDDETCFFLHDHTSESFINEARQRLCKRAWNPTQSVVHRILQAMYESDEPYFKALAICSVPNCVFQYGCPEGKFDCGWWKAHQIDFAENLHLRRLQYLTLMEV
jgi:hypothetical protein